MKEIHLPCPKCGKDEARVALHLWAPGDPDDALFHCHECDEDISVTELRDWMARWNKVLAWAETMPKIQ